MNDTVGETKSTSTKVAPPPPPTSANGALVPQRRRANRGKLSIILLFGFLAMLIPLALSGWLDVFTSHFKLSGPRIAVTKMPRGLGVVPVEVVFTAYDPQAGIDQVMVVAEQRGHRKELFRRQLNRAIKSNLTVPFDPRKNQFEEGPLTLSLIARDATIWRNISQEDLQLMVDYHKPAIDVKIPPSSIGTGETSSVIFSAIDEDLADQGVRVGWESFPAYPASGFDSAIQDNRYFVALFTLPFAPSSSIAETGRTINSGEINPFEHPAKIYAEDRVGNSASRVLSLSPKASQPVTSVIEISDDYLRTTVANLYDMSVAELASAAAKRGEPISTPNIFDQPDKVLLEKFKILDGTLREQSNNEVQGKIFGPRAEKLWVDEFQPPSGKMEIPFGSKVSYTYHGEMVLERHSTGMVLSNPLRGQPAYAANAGIVAYAGQIGVYGRTVIIDHGLGVYTMYGYLDDVMVNRGEAAKKGQRIGIMGNTGLSPGNALYYALLLNGNPVNPKEWSDPGSYESLIQRPIDELKRGLGITVIRELR